MTLVFTILVLALLLWQARRREREARRQGYVQGQYEAMQRSAERERRHGR